MNNSLLVKTFRFNGDGFDLLYLFKNHRNLFFLDSSLHHEKKGRFSFIGFDPFDFVENQKSLQALRARFKKLRVNVKSSLTPFPAGIAGCLSYDYGLFQEKIKLQARDNVQLSLLSFGFYDCMLTIDHQTEQLIVTGLSSSKKKFDLIVKKINFYQMNNKLSIPRIKSQKLLDKNRAVRLKVESNFTRSQYCQAVEKVLQYIAAGDVYQVNLSQRFAFDLKNKKMDKIRLYQTLREVSPSDFSCYFDSGDFQIISSSPERFLNLRDRIVTTSPMKGTRKRGKNANEDQRLKTEILNSKKDKAELLMVTDLERNDLGRVCEFGSVKVKKMREIEQYRFVYQTTSTVEGILRRDKDPFDLLQACFPSGSITGCPKIRAMEIIEELEPDRRGFYTGSLGYISFTGEMDFNVLIRTLLINQNKIYFHAGGGIVADSKPKEEYRETLIKAEAMRLSLAKFLEREVKR